MLKCNKKLYVFLGQMSLWTGLIIDLFSLRCPTRSGLLCSVMEKSAALTLHDVQSWAVMSEDGEPVVTERNVECHYYETAKTEGRK